MKLSETVRSFHSYVLIIYNVDTICHCVATNIVQIEDKDMKDIYFKNQTK